MNKQDKATLEYLKQLIKEVKQEMKTKKMIVENKTPEKVFNDHEKNMKEYVVGNVWESLKDSVK